MTLPARRDARIEQPVRERRMTLFANIVLRLRASSIARHFHCGRRVAKALAIFSLLRK